MLFCVNVLFSFVLFFFIFKTFKVLKSACVHSCITLFENVFIVPVMDKNLDYNSKKKIVLII